MVQWITPSLRIHGSISIFEIGEGFAGDRAEKSRKGKWKLNGFRAHVAEGPRAERQ